MARRTIRSLELHDLARVVARGMFGREASQVDPSRFEPTRIDFDVARAVIAAGYRKPRPRARILQHGRPGDA